MDYVTELYFIHTGGLERPRDINDQLMLFPPKGAALDDGVAAKGAVFRHPSELRPLSLKNADNEITGGLANWQLSPAITDNASSLQSYLFLSLTASIDRW